MVSMLQGEVPLKDDFPSKIEQGSSILRCGDFLLPVWVAARVSLMIDDNEQDILRLKLGIENRGEEE